MTAEEPGAVFERLYVIPTRYVWVMELIMNTRNRKSIDIEELLSAAGIDFTVVERCPYAECELCADKGLPVAA